MSEPINFKLYDVAVFPAGDSSLRIVVPGVAGDTPEEVSRQAVACMVSTLKAFQTQAARTDIVRAYDITTIEE
ncbi:hypothetical protein AB3X91_03615 [Paraburkholderia sp. BR14263]|uniref:hypothetical protein n=1 Tax=unclassified Paraburkholderia TaxID=2615204 RepID=UPI0034CE0B87